MPTDLDIARIAAVLRSPDDAVLPVSDIAAEAEPLLRAARLDDPLPDSSEPTVLAVGTTGSTGAPKVVLHSASSLRASIETTAVRMGGPGQWLLMLPIIHIAGIQVVLRAKVAGTPLVQVQPGDFVTSVADGVRRMTGRRYTSMVPTQLRRLLDDPVGVDALSGLDAILLGGAAADPAMVDEARALGVDVLTTYGASETAGGCVYDGVPLDGLSVSFDEGVITLRGPMVAQGYLVPPEPNPFRDGGFVTSDIGELVDGRLRVYGRADDVINTGGKKVAPTRVEGALRGLPGIADALVVGLPDAEWGEQVGALLVTPNPRESPAAEPSEPFGSSEPLQEAVRAQLRGILARHEVPKTVLFVEALPLKGIGKPDRAAARAELLRWVRDGSGANSRV